MTAQRWITVTAIALVALALPASAIAAPGGQGQGKPSDGARTLGDPLLPQIGNGGYDVDHYRIYLDYDPVTNVFNSAKTTIDATMLVPLRCDTSKHSMRSGASVIPSASWMSESALDLATKSPLRRVL